MTTIDADTMISPVRPADPVPSGAPADAVTRIDPVGGWPLPNVRELWKFRGLLYFLAWRDVKVRYKQTFMGAAWAILQPTLWMIVFTSFLGRIAKVPHGEMAYPLFVYLGVLPWTFFATAITASGNSVVGSERLVTKIYFPRLAIPIAASGAAFVDFLIGLCLMIGMMIYYGVAPGATVVLVPVIFLSVTMTALGVGMALSALNVLYRDFRYVMPFMMQVWMFATPSIYMSSRPDHPWANVLLHLNPMTGLVSAFRNACVGQPINYVQLAGLIASSALVFAIGACFFRRLESRFADVI